MRLTMAGEYAVRAVLCLSHRGKGVLVPRRDIAREGTIPSHFLSKIAQQLARAAIIEIKQGSRGGYILRHDPAEVSLLNVVEAIIGEIYPNDCVDMPESCGKSASCAVNRVWIRARDQLRATLAGVSFADLLEEESCCNFKNPDIDNRVTIMPLPAQQRIKTGKTPASA